MEPPTTLAELRRDQARPSGILRAMSSTFGQAVRITTFGESHGGGVGVVVDGCPPRLAISLEEIQRDLDRRRPGRVRQTSGPLSGR